MCAPLLQLALPKKRQGMTYLPLPGQCKKCMKAMEIDCIFQKRILFVVHWCKRISELMTKIIRIVRRSWKYDKEYE